MVHGNSNRTHKEAENLVSAKLIKNVRSFGIYAKKQPALYLSYSLF